MPRVGPLVRDVTALLVSALAAALVAALWSPAFLAGPLLAAALVAWGVAAAVAAASVTAARVALAAASGLLVAAAYFDARLYALFGIHLYDRAVTSLVGEAGANTVVHVTGGEAALIVAVVVAAAAGAYAVTIVSARLWARRAPARPRALLAALVAVAIAADGAALVSSRRALGDALFGRVGHVDALAIHYPKPPAGAPVKMQRRPNIVLVLVETLRSDMLAPAFMPELSRFADAQACDRSQRHYSASHVTDFSFFSLVYGLNAYYYLPFAQQKVPSYPLRVFRENGYAVVGAASAQLAKWGDLGDVTSQFDSFAAVDGKGPAERDRQLADWATRWRQEHGAERPYLMLLFFDATHHKYFYPPAFERFRPALPEDHNLVTGKVQDPEVRRGFVNRYKNAVGYVDHLVAGLGADFAAAAHDDLVFVVTGDHGEEFWDNGLLGHTAVSFVNARTEVPLVLCTPDRAARRYERSSEVDVMPTLLDQARLSPPVPPAAFSDGASLVGAPDPERFLLVSGMGFPFTNRQVCLISRTRKYWLEKERTGDKRFVLQRATDLDDAEAPPLADELARGIAWLERSYRTFYTP